MGKSKKRILNRAVNDKITNITRSDALCNVVKASLSKKIDNDVKDLITLFGFSAEEMLEAGAKYEDVVSLKGILN